jgi:hypothetical protein
MNFKTHRLILSLAALFTIAAVFAGCNLFDNADDITFPSQIEATWTVEENAEGKDKTYSTTKTLSLTDDREVEKYINKLKDVQIEKVTYRVEEYQAKGAAVIFNNGVASFATGASGSLEVSFTASASGVNLQTATADTELEIDVDKLNELASVLKADKELQMNVSGVLTKTPVSFKIVSTFYLRVTAEVLD